MRSSRAADDGRERVIGKVCSDVLIYYHAPGAAMKRRQDALTMSKFLSRFLGQTNTLTVHKEMILWLDHDIPAALLVGQLVFWHDRTDDDDFWVYKTYGDWRKEIALSEYQVRRATKKLKELGFVETKLRKINGAPTLHYRLDLDKFSEWILEKLQNPEVTASGNDPEEPSESLPITQTTPETTAENDDVHLSRYRWMQRHEDERKTPRKYRLH